MCLNYPKVFKHEVLNCVKCLCKNNKGFYTPYRSTKVRKDGWIIPRNWGKFDPDAEYIEGNFIHAYQNTYKDKDNINYFDAYAVNVVAQDCYMKEIVCRALYVPSADKDYNSRRRNKNFFKKNPSLKEIRERFPFLKKRI